MKDQTDTKAFPTGNLPTLRSKSSSSAGKVYEIGRRLRSAAIPLLTHAVNHAQPHLDRSKPVGQRLRALWAAAVAARDLGASDVVEEEFLQLARESGLFADLGSRANAELRHVIRWAIRNLNPFH